MLSQIFANCLVSKCETKVDFETGKEDTLPVSLQLDEKVIEVAGEPSVRDVPQLDGAVLRGRGDDVVVERVPLDVQHGAAVAGNL